MLIFLAMILGREDSLPYYKMEEVIVTASKTEEKRENATKCVEVIYVDSLMKEGIYTLEEALNTITGVEVITNGTIGGKGYVFLRGTNSGHTLILFNGMKLIDPSSSIRMMDLAHISLEGIERIEIVKGPQSALYGSEAIGGIINIIPKTRKPRLPFYFQAELGSYQTFKAYSHFGIGVGWWGVREFGTAIDYHLSKGFSKVKPIEGQEEEEEKDLYERKSFFVWANKRSKDKRLQWEGCYLIRDIVNEIDRGAFVDDPNYWMKGKQKAANLKVKDNIIKNWQCEIKVGVVKNVREYVDTLPDEDVKTDDYKGEIWEGGWINRIFINKVGKIVTGLEWEEEKAEVRRKRKDRDTTSSWYRKGKSVYGEFVSRKYYNLLFTMGGRYDFYSSSRVPTYQLSLAYFLPIKGVKLKTNYGKGFKLPSLFQLYSMWGNSSLLPEKGDGWDIGVEVGHKNVEGEITFFNNQQTDLISFDMDSRKYKNVNFAEEKGVEVGINLFPKKWYNMGMKYTHLNTRDEKGKPLPMRADYRLKMIGRIKSRLIRLTLTYTRVGKRETRKGKPLSSYSLLDIYLTSSLFLRHTPYTIYLKIKNVWDEKYYEIYGYNTLGQSVYVGISSNFFNL